MTIRLQKLLALFLVAASFAPFGCRSPAVEERRDVDLLRDPQRIRLQVPPGTQPAASVRWEFESEEGVPWTVHSYSGQASGGATAERAHGGVRSFCIESVGGAADADAEVKVDVGGKRRYRLDAYVQTDDLDPATARVYGTLALAELDAADAGEPSRWHVGLPKFSGTTDGWQHIAYDFETKSETRRLRIAAILGRWGAASGRICIDDVVLSAADGAPAAGDARVVQVQQVDIGGDLRRAIDASPSSEYRLSVDAPRGAHLQLGFGASRDATFTVAAATNAGERILFSKTIDQTRDPSAPSWRDADMSFGDLAGAHVDLVLRTAGPPPSLAQDPRGNAFWSSPDVFVPRNDGERRRQADVVLITIDALRPDHLGCYGYGKPTSPAIDAFARDAVLFENAFTTMPRTASAIASLMTGLYPRGHGVMTSDDRLETAQPTLAEVLEARGFATGAVVPRDVARRTGLQRGFDSYADHEQAEKNDPKARADALAREAEHWIEAHAGRPEFLWLHLWDPHFPYAPPAEIAKRFGANDSGFDLFDRVARGEIAPGQLFFAKELPAADVEQAVARYDGEVRMTDDAVGQFLQELKRRGLYDSALIVIAGDTGESLGDHGSYFAHGEYLYDSALRIPLLVKFPSARGKGQRVRADTGIFDLYPTILAAAGAAASRGGPGVDLSACIDRDCDPHPTLFAETGQRFSAENPRRYLDGIAGNWRSIRTARWKLIQIPTPQGNQYELYDVAKDPGEEHDVYRSDDATAESLTEQLAEWLTDFDAARWKTSNVAR